MEIKENEIQKVWTEGTGSGQYSGNCFIFIQLTNGKIFSKSSTDSRYFTNTSWHLIFDPSVPFKFT